MRSKNLPLIQKTFNQVFNQRNSISELTILPFYMNDSEVDSGNFLMAQKLLRYLQLSAKLILLLSKRFTLFNNIESEIFESVVPNFINN